MIKDSGERTEFPSGGVRDMRDGKGRFDLCPMVDICDLFEGEVLLTHDRSPLYWFCQYVCSAKHSIGVPKYAGFSLQEFARINKWDLPTMMLELAKHFEEGAKKYGENNWCKGLDASCYVDSAIRHYYKWLRGDKDEPHDRAFVWNVVCLVWTIRNKPSCRNLKKLDAFVLPDYTLDDLVVKGSLR